MKEQFRGMLQLSAMMWLVTFALVEARSATPPPGPMNMRILQFVSPTGSQTNSGLTADSPWPVDYALAQVATPVTIVLLPGVYPSIGITQPGTKLVSQTKWAAKVVGTPGSHGIWTAPGAAGVIIDGIEVANSAMDGICLGGSNNIVRNCWVHDSSGSGISAHEQVGALVERNLVEHNGSFSGANQGQGHGVYVSGQDHIVRGNVVRNNAGFGIQLYTGYAGIWQNHNYFYNNLVYGHTNRYGVTLWGAVDPTGQLPGTNYLFNNTILDGASLWYGAVGLTNNIILPSPINPGVPVYSSGSQPPTVWADYNLGTNTISPAGAHDVIRTVATSTLFVNTAKGLYWLCPTSSARNVAADVAMPVDFFGSAPPTVADIGAFQFSAGQAGDTRVLDPTANIGADYWTPLTSAGISPCITSQPQSQRVVSGQSATFTVTATGDAPLSYQWTFNGTNVGSGSSCYTRASCQVADSGGRVLVTVANANGTIQSSSATLAVDPPGTYYYVSPDGSSANNGLAANSPWPMQYGLDQLGPGITVIALPGVYTGPFHIYSRNGTAAKPATFCSQFKWKAIIADSTTRGLELYNAQYVVVDGLCISNSLADGIKVMDAKDTIRNCWITHNGNTTAGNGYSSNGVTDTNNLFECNLVEWNGSFTGANQGHGHGIYISGHDHVVRGNVVRNNAGFGIQVYSAYAGVWQNHNSIYNNLIYGHTNRYGVTLWGAVDPTGQLPGTNYLFNNTILDGASLWYGTAGMTNNIILPSPINPGVPVYSSGSPPLAIWADYNLGTNAISPAGAHDVIRNTARATLFANMANGLYWLSPTSPARNVAAHLTPPVDFFGCAAAAVTDIGAFQYNTGLSCDTRVLDPCGNSPDYWINISSP